MFHPELKLKVTIRTDKTDKPTEYFYPEQFDSSATPERLRWLWEKYVTDSTQPPYKLEPHRGAINLSERQFPRLTATFATFKDGQPLREEHFYDIYTTVDLTHPARPTNERVVHLKITDQLMDFNFENEVFVRSKFCIEKLFPYSKNNPRYIFIPGEDVVYNRVGNATLQLLTARKKSWRQNNEGVWFVDSDTPEEAREYSDFVYFASDPELIRRIRDFPELYEL